MLNDSNCTLQDIAYMYKENLLNKLYIFNVKDKNTPIRIRFDEGHLAHLIGLHYFNYRKGEKLFAELLEGKITWDILIRRNEGNYKQYEYRMKNMIYLRDVLDQSNTIVYYSGGIKADLMIYHHVVKRYLALGILKIKDDNIFMPTTFIENKRNKFTNLKHIVVVDKEIKEIKY